MQTRLRFPYLRESFLPPPKTNPTETGRNRGNNNRLQPTQIDVDSGVLTLDFTYGTTADNGNVLTQRMRAPGSPSNLDATQYYLYDSLNRLGIVTEGAAPTGAMKQAQDGHNSGHTSAPTRNELGAETPLIN